MKIKDYLNILNEQDNSNIQIQIIEFFKNNPSPTDKEVHAFSKRLNIDEHKFEEMIYKLLGSFFGAGRSKNFKGKYDSKELKMGTIVEMEHTTNTLISERIAKDHLAECSDYYTLLDKMEKTCKKV